MMLAQVQTVANTTADAASRIVETGVIGSVAVLLGIALLFLWRDSKTAAAEYLDTIEKLQTQRVADSQAVTQQILNIAKEAATNLSVATSAIQANKESMSDLRDSVESLTNELRNRRGAR